MHLLYIITWMRHIIFRSHSFLFMFTSCLSDFKLPFFFFFDWHNHLFFKSEGKVFFTFSLNFWQLSCPSCTHWSVGCNDVLAPWLLVNAIRCYIKLDGRRSNVHYLPLPGAWLLCQWHGPHVCILVAKTPFFSHPSNCKVCVFMAYMDFFFRVCYWHCIKGLMQ